MPKKSRQSVQKRERESRKNERRLRKAERAAVKQERPAGAPDPGPAIQAAEGSHAADVRLRGPAGAPHEVPEHPLRMTAGEQQVNTP